MRTRIVIPTLVLIWLIIGAIAAGQRGYFSDSDADCASVGTVLVTVLAGPLNYVGVNAEVECPDAPQPSE